MWHHVHLYFFPHHIQEEHSVTLRLKGEIADSGRRPLLGSGSVNIVSASAVLSRDNRRVAGRGFATLPGARRAVPLQWNTRYVTHINRGTVFSVVFVQELYLENRNTSQQVQVESLVRSIERVCRQTDRPV
jgi:hypothetical protein